MLGRSSNDGSHMQSGAFPTGQTSPATGHMPPPTGHPSPNAFFPGNYNQQPNQNVFSRPERANQYQGVQTPTFPGSASKQEQAAHPARPHDEGVGGQDESQLSESFFDHQLMGMSPDAPWGGNVMQGVMTHGMTQGLPTSAPHSQDPSTRQWGFPVNPQQPGLMHQFAPQH